jgi:hypothetical protein
MSDHKHLVQVRTSLNGRFSYAITCLEALASVCTACFDSPMSKVTTIHSSNSKENALHTPWTANAIKTAQ